VEQWKDNASVDTAFRRLFSTLPALEPSAGFAQRTVEAAWAARAARQRRVRWAAAAAAIAIVSVASLGAMAVLSRLLLTAAQVGTVSVMAVVWSATAMAEFWGSMASAGAVAARVAVMPHSMTALIGAELLGGTALYLLHRLLRGDVRFRNSGPLCL
jgi:hypothetical protein